MRDNITKVAERGERLDSLQDKTGALRLTCMLMRPTPLMTLTGGFVQIIWLCLPKGSAAVPTVYARYVQLVHFVTPDSLLIRSVSEHVVSIRPD